MTADRSLSWEQSARQVPALDVWREGDGMVVALYGEQDMASAPALSRRLASLQSSCVGDIVADLSQTTFLDTSTIMVLAGYRQLLGRQDRTMTLRHPSSSIRRVLMLCGLADFIQPAARAG